ncbi:hypothetical protein ACQV5M_19240, partial [Leptospira sp. SA-E8]|uniref:hypothetical protein n=1 Tax=Leptospira sp. SA-E8 TaxID=3422259 RepID=UPI003EB9AE83
ERTVVAGFSQGGILSASVGLTAPERVQGFAVLAGRILPELEPMLASRDRLGRLHALIAHGRDDDKLPVSWAERAHAWLDTLGVAHALRLYPGGHGIGMTMAADFHDWVTPLLLTPGLSAMALHLGAEEVQLVQTTNGAEGSQAQRVAPGVEAVVREHLTRPGSMAFKIESAIAAIEDELAKVPAAVRGAETGSDDPLVLDIARVAGLDAAASRLSREAVEQVFQRLSAVALGSPAASSGLPDDLRFAAGVVTLRELMHHLDIRSITLAR